ncbi:MAG: hypothetical protein P4M01_11075, partial [Acidobacteriota bacterium]|nr:hypothetical protein [Acidobacteriota bacterium]
MSRLVSVAHGSVDGSSYSYDSAGNRTAKTSVLSGLTDTYGYDVLYQLKSVLEGGRSTESYTYDAVGNRLSSLGVSPYSYNVSNQLVSTPSYTFTYDANGNMLTRTSSSGSTSYGWDYENRLALVAIPQDDGTTSTVTFQYDPFGRRIYKSSSSGTAIYAYDGANIVAEVNASGTYVAKYAQGAGIDEPLAMQRGGSTAYYNADGLGSITSLTGGTGVLASTYTYDSFGNTTATEGIHNPFRYT